MSDQLCDLIHGRRQKSLPTAQGYRDGSFLFPSVSFPFQIPILLGGCLFQSPLMGSPVRGDRGPIQAHDCRHSMENGVVGNGADPGPLSMASLLGPSQPVPPLVMHPNDFHAPSEEGLQEILLPSHTCSWTKETLHLGTHQCHLALTTQKEGHRRPFFFNSPTSLVPPPPLPSHPPEALQSGTLSGIPPHSLLFPFCFNFLQASVGRWPPPR